MLKGSRWADQLILRILSPDKIYLGMNLKGLCSRTSAWTTSRFDFHGPDDQGNPGFCRRCGGDFSGEEALYLDPCWNESIEFAREPRDLPARSHSYEILASRLASQSSRQTSSMICT